MESDAHDGDFVAQGRHSSSHLQCIFTGNFGARGIIIHELIDSNHSVIVYATSPCVSTASYHNHAFISSYATAE